MVDTKPVDPSVSVTGITGGQADTVIASGIVHGGVNINAEVRRKLKALFEETSSKIELRSQMERTSAVDEITGRLEAGDRWIVITGCPGEGKTVLGYMVLASMKEKGWDVLSLESPENYHFVSSSRSPDNRIVYLLDDILGAHVFERSTLLSWQPLLNNIHENLALIFKYKRSPTSFSNEFFLFIGRTNVFKSARSFFAKHEVSVFGGNVFDLSKRHITEERLLLLRHHLQRKDITLPGKDVEKVANASGISPHGFAHCCEIYADLHATLQHDKIDIYSFFHKPLQFLNQTLKILFKHTEIKTLFAAMVKCDGRYNIDYETNTITRNSLKEAESKLLGVYVTTESGMTSFSHPSVYESVTLQFGREDPRYVLEHCNVSFLADRIKLEVQGEVDDSGFIVIDPNNFPLTHLLRGKFIQALEEGLFDIIGSHSCRNMSFCGKLLESFSGDGRNTSDCKRRLNQIDERGFTLLHAAARYGNTAAIRVLLRLGADINRICGGQTEDKGKTALHLLCENYPNELNTDLLEVLISHGADINASTSDGMPVLHYVSGGESMEISHGLVSYLIQHGADRYRSDKFGKLAIPWDYTVRRKGAAHSSAKRSIHVHSTDLISSIMEGDMTRVDALIKQGADRSEADHFGRTALHYLCLSPSINLDILSALLHQVNTKDMYGNTPLHLLCRRNDIEKVKGWRKVFEALVSHGGDVNVFDEFGFSSLLYLRGILDINLAKVLTSSCSNLDEDNGDGMSLVHFCTIQGMDKCLQLIINKGVDVNKGVSRDVSDSTHYVMVKGMTPLQLACRSDKTNLNILKLLLDNKAGVSDAGRTGSTPLYYVCSGFLKFTWLVPGRVWYLTPSRSTMRKKRLAMCDLLIQAGADLYRQNTRGILAYHGCLVERQALPSNNFKSEIDKITRELTQLIASDQTGKATKIVNKYKPRRDKFGRTCLHLLCLSESLEAGVAKMFSSVVDVNQKDTYGNTALYYLCRREDILEVPNRHQLLEVLLLQGADINLYDEINLSALCYLREILTDKLVDVLLFNCPDISSDNGDGLCLLHYVCLHQSDGYLEKLLPRVADIDQPVSCDIKSDRESLVISEGETALHLVCRSDCCSKETVQALLDRGACVNSTTRTGVTPLHLICELPFRFVTYNSRTFLDWDCVKTPTSDETDMVRFSICCMLLQRGAERTRMDKEGRPALHGRYKRRYESEEKQMLLLQS